MQNSHLFPSRGEGGGAYEGVALNIEPVATLFLFSRHLRVERETSAQGWMPTRSQTYFIRACVSIYHSRSWPEPVIALCHVNNVQPAAAFLDLSAIRGIRIWARVPVDDFEALINDGHEERPSPTKRNRGNCVSSLLIYATPSLSLYSKLTPVINNCFEYDRQH